MRGTTNHTRSYSKAFALPAVMIAAVVMMMVLVSGLSATTSINSGLRQQYKAMILDEAVKAGMSMAENCLQNNGGNVTWTAANPLRPNTDCSGTQSVSCSTPPTTDTCAVSNTDVAKTTFSVSYDTTNQTIIATGTYYSVSKSNSTLIRSTNTSSKRLNIQTSSSANIPNGDAIAASQVAGSDGGDSQSVSYFGGSSSSAVHNVCATQASNGVVTCASNNFSAPANPFGSTAMRRAIDANYTYCAVTMANTALCTDDTSNSPFGTTQIKNITASNSANERICGVRLSDNIVQCASLGGTPFGSTAMKDVVLSSDSTSYACAIQKSNDQVTCANVIASPFGTTAMKKIELTMATSTNSRYICGIRYDNANVSCVTPNASPFGTAQMIDMSVAVSGTTNGNYVCGLASTSLQVACASITSSPFGSTQMLDVSVAADSGAKVCGIAQSNRLVSCTDATSSPFGSTALEPEPQSAPASSQTNFLWF